MTEGPPSSGGVALSVPEPSQGDVDGAAPKRRGWVKRLLLGLAVVLTLATVGFEAHGLTTDRSMDVPLPDGVRPGFFGNAWPVRWTCSAGHDHWSLPYWSGTLFLLALAAVTWRAWSRRRVSRSG